MAVTVRSTTGTAPLTFERIGPNQVLIQLEDGSQQVYRLNDLLAALGEPAPETTSVAPDFKAKLAGKRVKYVGMTGNVDGPVGKVWRVTTKGVWVTLDDGSRQQWHPDDIRVVTQ